jgi:hypothetical protein
LSLNNKLQLMSALDNAIITPIERGFSALPGGTEPAIRSLYGGAIGAAIVFGLKPSFMFMPGGQPKRWFVFEPDDPNSTWMPYWAGVLLPAFFFGVMI